MTTVLILLLAGVSNAQETTKTAPRGVESTAEPTEAPADEAPADEATEDGDTVTAPREDWTMTPPPEVEPGSERLVYVVEEGDTIDSIAMNQGFLPDDIRRWNRIEGEVAPGDEVILWVAPMEEEPEAPAPVIDVAEAEEAPKKGKKEKKEREDDGDDKSGVGFFAGVQVGPSFSLSPLKPAVAPRLELGLELPPLDRSFRIFVSGQYLRPKAIGDVSDDRVPGGSFSYEVNQDELSIAFGPSFRAGMIDGPVKPEVAVGPNVFLYRSTANGSAGGSAFPESQEQYTRVGIYAAAGIGAELGPGELTAHFMFQSSAFKGVITGEANSASLSPMVGYRFVF